MSTQVTIIIIAAIIAICYLATLVLNHLWNKEKQNLSFVMESIKSSLSEVKKSLNETNKRIEYIQSCIDTEEEE